MIQLTFIKKTSIYLVLITTDLERKIADAFLIFDHHANKTVDVREVGTILRYLGKSNTRGEPVGLYIIMELLKSN